MPTDRNKKKVKVAVALSGGVDSSMAAALLQEQGYDVFGLFMKFWPIFSNRAAQKHESHKAQLDAEEVARSLAIPLYSLSLTQSFRKFVLKDFIASYRRGLTPNPCVRCNRYIKFGILLEQAKKLGADYLATGHYARIKTIGGVSKLLRGRDPVKDQSYFLYSLTQRQLRHVLFPVGKYYKSEIRSMAKERRLPSVQRPESQDLCFTPDGYRVFLKRYCGGSRPGLIVDTGGEVIGRHQGLALYTLGQRAGLGISRRRGPYFVVGYHLKKNQLVASTDEEKLKRKELLVRKIHWVSGHQPPLPFSGEAQIRYRQGRQKMRITKRGSGYRIVFRQPQRAITPGQSIVFYKRDEVLGGTVIGPSRIT